MTDNDNIRLLTPENDMRVRAFFSSLEELFKRVEKIRKDNKPSLDGERYYTDKELAVILKVSRRSLQDYRNNGILPYTQIGGRILYRASDIERTLMDGYKEAYRLKGNMWLANQQNKSREKIIALLSQDNTLSATALAQQTGYSDESGRTRADIDK